MKHVPVPATLTLRILNIEDEPKIFDGTDDAGKPKPAVIDYRKWLLNRLRDPAFFESPGKPVVPGKPAIEGIDAIELLQLAREQIKENCQRTSGFHSFDDAVAKQLRHSILHPTGGHLCDLEIVHNFIPWVLIWKPEPLAQLPTVATTPPLEEQKES